MNDNKKILRCQIVGSIYLIYCNVTDKCYVGQTIQKVSERMYKHKSGKGQYIDEEIRKIGWEGNFDYFVLEENIPLVNLNTLEKFWIEVFDSVYPNGYNLTHGGQARFTISEELRARRRELFSGENNPNYGDHAPQSEEVNAKRRATNLAKGIRPPVMYGEKNPNYGKDFSPEHRAKLSAAKKGKPSWNKGKKCPQISAGRMGTPCAEKTKIKIRATLIKKDIMKKIFAALIELLSQ